MVRSNGRGRRTLRRSWVGAMIASLFIVAVPFASAQTGAGTPVASGEFKGVVGLDGGFRIDLPEGGDITVTLEGTGPLELTLADGTMTGTWSLDAIQTTSGDLGGGISISGGGTITASGAMGGPPGTYKMTGTYSQTNTATVESPVGSSSSTVTDSGAVDVPLNDVLVLCDDIVGRWDYQVKQDLESAGFDEFVRGYFSATTGIDATEQAEEVEALIGDINTWASSAPLVESGRRSVVIGMGLALLDRAQRLQAQLDAPTPCPPDPTFMTALSLAAQDVLNELIDRFPGITNPYVVSLALGSGAIGEGSPAPDAADALQAKMEADIDAKFDALNNDADRGRQDYIKTARAGQQLGMETIGSTELSPGDVLFVEGASE